MPDVNSVVDEVLWAADHKVFFTCLTLRVTFVSYVVMNAEYWCPGTIEKALRNKFMPKL